MDQYIYDGTTESLREVARLYKEGVKILCPICRGELLVALDFETANEKKVHTGIYCRANAAHVCEMIELRHPTKQRTT